MIVYFTLGRVLQFSVKIGWESYHIGLRTCNQAQYNFKAGKLKQDDTFWQLHPIVFLYLVKRWDDKPHLLQGSHNYQFAALVVAQPASSAIPPWGSHAAISHLRVGGIDELECSDGEPHLPAGGLLLDTCRGKGDEQRAGREQAQRSDEEGSGR